MSKNQGTQKKLEKVRAPRVKLTYEVERGDAIEARELPFVVGVMGDFSGKAEATKRLKERAFVQVDVDNFDEVVAGLAPRASFDVPDLVGGQGRFHVDLTFNALEDFRPESVASRVEPLRLLMEARDRLEDLRNKMNGNDRLEDLLAEAIANTPARADEVEA